MKRPAAEALDMTRWPGVDVKALALDVRPRFRQRVAAVQAYARGVRISEVERQTGLDRRTLYRTIERAVKAHPDGRPWGYRALIPSLRTKAYERRTKLKPTTTGRGYAGEFAQLLDRHSELEQLLRRMIQERMVWLTQKEDTFYLHRLKYAHQRFLEACRSLGLTARDYPLNSEEKARRSLGRNLRDRMLSGFNQAARSALAPNIKPAAALAFAPEMPVTEPFDTVEFDAHKLDVRLKILDQDPYGEAQIVEIERVWLLALIDVATRAILGYTLCLRREYSRYDVIRTFEQALKPAPVPRTTIPGLEPMQGGGFVSTVLPETAYACWQRIRFDNARAHLAADSLDVACELLGCTVDVGPAYEPNDRPFIERFFGTVASQFSHRLPGTTGSNATDLVRELSRQKGDLRLVVGFDELQELLALWVWNYNGAPHSGLGGRTPLEAMTAAIRRRQTLLRYLPEALRANLCLLQSAHRGRVRGNVSRGDKPHVSFYHVRYTSPALAQSPHLIGKHLRIYYDVDDIRVLRAYLPDGTELGELSVGGLWRRTPHSLDTRRRIFRAKRLRQIRFDELEDPVETYLNYKRAQSKRSRKAASEIAHIKQGIAADKSRPASDQPDEAADRLPLAVGPVKARVLRIPPGFA